MVDRYPHSLPESQRRLQRKYDEYLREGYVCFISKKWQNANAAKVDDDIKESVLVQLIAHHNNIDNAAIAGLYNAVARQKGWKEITASTAGVWRDKYDLVCSRPPRGDQLPQHAEYAGEADAPDGPFLMWTLDTSVKFIIHNLFIHAHHCAVNNTLLFLPVDGIDGKECIVRTSPTGTK